MLAIVTVLLLASHLLCMNVASAGPLLCIWLARKRASPQSVGLARNMASSTVWMLLAGVAFGVLVGLVSSLTGDRQFIDTIPLFRRKIIWGLIELLFSLGWMTGYWAWLKWKPPQSSAARWLCATLPVLSATNLLYHFPPLLTVMAKVAAGELTVAEDVDAETFRSLLYTPNVLAHTLHFWLASFAVSGVYLFWLVRKQKNPQPYFVFGARCALVATALQFPSGLWLLFTTPPGSQSRLVGGDGLTTGLLVASLFCAFYLLQNLTTLGLGEANEKLPRRCVWLLVATVVMMTGTLHLLR